MTHKYVYFFGAGQAEGTAGMKDLLGGKGANLAEMTNIGIPVPPGFTITTEVCSAFYQNNKQFPEGLKEQVLENLRKVEGIMGMSFGDSSNPLLVSVRSGARASMPGMMDTVLNLGLNEETVRALIAKTDNSRFAYDSYRRFVAMYGDVVLGLKPENRTEEDPFEVLIEQRKRARGVVFDTELELEDLKGLVSDFKAMIRSRLGVEFPEDPMEQLWGSIGAVFASWSNPRAIAYRELNNIPSHWGTAVNVQAMVFGNMGTDSGTGVAFTRNPATGDNVFYGEYLMNAQGEDVVAGIRTPQPINKAQKADALMLSLEEEAPGIYEELVAVRNKLEKHYREMQDLEFTIQKGKLWILQTRSGKRTAVAAVRIATDMLDEGLVSEPEMLLRLEPNQLNQFLRPIFNEREWNNALKEGRLLAKGLAAGPGAATGRVVFSAEDAEEWAKRGEMVILTRIETSPEDIRGMHASQGILTSRGGMTSHAALVARQMGKVCVAGCGALVIRYKDESMEVAGQTVRKGDWIAINGHTGEVVLGQVGTRPSEVVQVLVERSLPEARAHEFSRFKRIMDAADKYRRLQIWTNADQPDQAANAVAFGAEGIGLCRTEHMFFEGDRIDAVREMIMAEDEAGRRAALAKLEPLQQRDFEGIFRNMQGRPTTVRLLDPPLHEFLPPDQEIEALSYKLNRHPQRLREKKDLLHEANPMLGHRGCRLGVSYPEIYEMQVRAIARAACREVKAGRPTKPEIMVPLVGISRELEIIRKMVVRVFDEVQREEGVKVDYNVGTMVELPRACVAADRVAEHADFFSFGTNDLTQTTFGFSRDDAERFLNDYREKEVLEQNPFETIDRQGVGSLMAIAVEKGRTTRPDLKIGICGEHGGEPRSVEFCHELGLNYVSCSPFRVPIAKLAAAQAALKESKER